MYTKSDNISICPRKRTHYEMDKSDEEENVYDNISLNLKIYDNKLNDIKYLSICELVALSSMFSLQTNFIYRNKEYGLSKQELINNILYTITNCIRPVEFTYIDYPDSSLPLTSNTLVLFHEYETCEAKLLFYKLTSGRFMYDTRSLKILRDSWRNNVLLTYEQVSSMYIKESSTYNIPSYEIHDYSRNIVIFSYIRNCLNESIGKIK